MTLYTYPDVEQRSDEWHDLRRGLVTASTVGRLITPKTIKPANNDESRSLTMLLASERITGWTYPTYQSLDMLRGTLDEPIARDLYAKHYAPVIECGFMIREESGFRFGFSPDGLVGNEGIVEFKSRRPKQQVETILANEVPLENVAQCQGALFVTGRAWCDYGSFSGGLPFFVKRVYPDERWFAAIEAALVSAEDAIRLIIAEYHEAIAGMPTTERQFYDDEIRVA